MRFSKREKGGGKGGGEEEEEEGIIRRRINQETHVCSLPPFPIFFSQSPFVRLGCGGGQNDLAKKKSERGGGDLAQTQNPLAVISS
jgi:hypothetical protein